LNEKETTGGYYLKNILQKNKSLYIVGVAENSIETLYALIQNQVDLMIIDKNLKSINDIDCAGMISKLNIDVKILLLLDDDKEFNNLKPGLFAGYILRRHSPGEIFKSIEHVLNTKLDNFILPQDEFAGQAVYG
jgi:DNA-binding NarL/FixJ family response regulator